MDAHVHPMTPDEFRALPESEGRANLYLCDADIAIEKIRSYTSVHSGGTLRQIQDIERFTEYKHMLLNMGATQRGADFVRDYKKAHPPQGK